MMKGIKILFGAIAVLYLFGTSYQMYIFLDFQSNKEEIIKEHCVNVDKPEMHCDGNCHLKKEISKAPIQAMNVEKPAEKGPSFTFVSFDTFNEVFYTQIYEAVYKEQQCCNFCEKSYSFQPVFKDFHPPEEV